MELSLFIQKPPDPMTEATELSAWVWVPLLALAWFGGMGVIGGMIEFLSGGSEGISKEDE